MVMRACCRHERVLILHHLLLLHIVGRTSTICGDQRIVMLAVLLLTELTVFVSTRTRDAAF